MSKSLGELKFGEEEEYLSKNEDVDGQEGGSSQARGKSYISESASTLENPIPASPVPEKKVLLKNPPLVTESLSQITEDTSPPTILENYLPFIQDQNLPLNLKKINVKEKVLSIRNVAEDGQDEFFPAIDIQESREIVYENPTENLALAEFSGELKLGDNEDVDQQRGSSKARGKSYISESASVLENPFPVNPFPVPEKNLFIVKRPFLVKDNPPSALEYLADMVDTPAYEEMAIPESWKIPNSQVVENPSEIMQNHSQLIGKNSTTFEENLPTIQGNATLIPDNPSPAQGSPPIEGTSFIVKESLLECYHSSAAQESSRLILENPAPALGNVYIKEDSSKVAEVVSNVAGNISKLTENVSQIPDNSSPASGSLHIEGASFLVKESLLECYQNFHNHESYTLIPDNLSPPLRNLHIDEASDVKDYLSQVEVPTPTQPILQPLSTMHVNDLPDDCIRLFLQRLTPLSELVSKAFVCHRWIAPIAQIIRVQPIPAHSLKLFDFDHNIDNYNELALMQYNLMELNPSAPVLRTGDYQEDHLFMRSFQYESTDYIVEVLVALFQETCTTLLLNSLVVDHAALVESMVNLVTLTLVELPDCTKAQNRIWSALNSISSCVNVHILNAGSVAFEVEEMDFLARLVNFTLDNYSSCNLMEILSKLSSDCRALQIGPFENGADVLAHLIYGNPEMVGGLTHLTIRPTEEVMQFIIHDEDDLLEPNDLNDHYENNYGMHKRMLLLISQHFLALQYLNLEFAAVLTLSDIMRALENLIHLETIQFVSSYDMRAGQWFRTVRQRNPHDALLPPPPPPVPLIPHLTIRSVRMVKRNYLALDDDIKLWNHLYPPFPVERLLNRPNVPPVRSTLFPSLEEVIIIVNTDNCLEWFNYSRDSIDSYRRRLIRHLPLNAPFEELALFDVAVGLLNRDYFSGADAKVEMEQRRDLLVQARMMHARNPDMAEEDRERIRIMMLGHHMDRMNAVAVRGHALQAVEEVDEALLRHVI